MKYPKSPIYLRSAETFVYQKLKYQSSSQYIRTLIKHLTGLHFIKLALPETVTIQNVTVNALEQTD